MSIFNRFFTAVLCLALSSSISFANEKRLTAFNWAYDIPNSNNRDQTIEFIDVVTKPENAALNASHLGPWNANLKSMDFSESIPTEPFENTQYYTDIRNIPMTLHHRIASSIITQHKRYQYEK